MVRVGKIVVVGRGGAPSPWLVYAGWKPYFKLQLQQLMDTLVVAQESSVERLKKLEETSWTSGLLQQTQTSGPIDEDERIVSSSSNSASSSINSELSFSAPIPASLTISAIKPSSFQLTV